MLEGYVKDNYYASGEAVLTSTHNLCFGAKIRKISKFLAEIFQIFKLNNILLYGQVFVMYML